MVNYLVKILYYGDLLGVAETDDRSIRMRSLNEPKLEDPDEVDIRSLEFVDTALEKLGNPQLLLRVLELAPLRLEITDQDGNPFQIFPACVLKDADQFLMVKIDDPKLYANITFQVSPRL
jgi:hypothetical protein